MKVKRYATFTTEMKDRKASRTLSYWRVMGILLACVAIVYAIGWLVGYQAGKALQSLTTP